MKTNTKYHTVRAVQTPTTLNCLYMSISAEANFVNFNCFLSHFIIVSLIIQEVDLQQMIADIVNVILFLLRKWCKL